MKRFLLTLAFLGAAPAAHAETINILDLTLRLESAGFSDVVVYDDNMSVVQEIDFLDQLDDSLTLSQPNSPFETDEEVSLTATRDDVFGDLTSCVFGGQSCVGAFGEIAHDSFSLGDGAGLTPFGDFLLSGGTEIGDSITLRSFQGAPMFAPIRGGGFTSWDTFDQQFVVVSNNLVVAPLPASLPFLVIAVGCIGFFRTKRKSASPQV